MGVFERMNPNGGFSTVPDKSIMDFEEQFGAHHYERLHMVVRRARGCWLFDENGNRYLDGLAAYSAANTGHHHPAIAKAVIQALQGEFASVLSNVVYTDPLGIFLEKAAGLPRNLPHGSATTATRCCPRTGGWKALRPP